MTPTRTTCNHCPHQFSDDAQENIDHLRTHWNIFDEAKRRDLDRWERNHHRFLEQQADWQRRLADPEPSP
jgi:hypothetical protein